MEAEEAELVGVTRCCKGIYHTVGADYFWHCDDFIRTEDEPSGWRQCWLMRDIFVMLSRGITPVLLYIWLSWTEGLGLSEGLDDLKAILRG